MICWSRYCFSWKILSRVWYISTMCWKEREYLDVWPLILQNFDHGLTYWSFHEGSCGVESIACQSRLKMKFVWNVLSMISWLGHLWMSAYPLAPSKLAQFTILSIELFSILFCLDIIIFFNELIKVGIFRNYVVKFWCTVLWKKKKGVRNVMYYITNWVISVANVWEKYGLKSCFYTDKLHIILNLVGQDLINHLNHASIHFS